MLLFAVIRIADASEKEVKVTSWYKVFEDKNVTCAISSYKDTTNQDQSQIIVVRIKNKGKNFYNVRWDEDFGRCLWGQEFVLVSDTNGKKEDTEFMMGATGGLFYPRGIGYLAENGELTSFLDFKSYPASHAGKLFRHKGNIKLILCVKDFPPKKDKTENSSLKHISNELNF